MKSRAAPVAFPDLVPALGALGFLTAALVVVLVLNPGDPWPAVGLAVVNLALTVGLAVSLRRRTLAPLRKLAGKVRALLAGERGVPFEDLDDPTELGHLARVLEEYRQAEVAAERRNARNLVYGLLKEGLQTASAFPDFGRRLGGGLAEHLGAVYSAFYRADPAQTVLTFEGGTGLVVGTQTQRFAWGEGLAGQAAQDGRSLWVDLEAPQGPQVIAGLGPVNLRGLAAFPLVHRGQVLGVIELGTLGRFDPENLSALEDFLSEAAEQLQLLAVQRQNADSEERLELAMTGAHLGLWDWNVRTGDLVINDIWAQMKGYTPAELDQLYPDRSQRWLAMTHPDDAPAASRALTDHMEGKTPFYRTEYRQRTKDGGWKWILDTGRGSDRDEKGQAHRMVGVHQDITERKNAEEALALANLQSDHALDLTRSGYWRIDYRDPDYYISSPRANAIYGEEPKPDFRYRLADEWLNRIEAADPALAAATGAHYADALAGKVPRYDFVYPYLRPLDGRLIWVHALGTIERGPDGQPTMMYGVAQDVTHLRNPSKKEQP